MASQGPLLAGSGASQGTGVAWANPGNVTADDAADASASLTSSAVTSAELYASTFGFSIPTGATIDGIEFTVEVENDAGGGIDDGGGTEGTSDGVHATKDGTYGVGSQLGNGTNWTTTPTVHTYGGPTELWGQTWTVSEINASTFGFLMKARRVAPGGSPVGDVDWVKATVYYTEAAGDRGAQVSFAELEVPDEPRGAQVSFAELEVPNEPRAAQVSFAELEVPDEPRAAQVSFVEFEVPDFVAGDRAAYVSFAEFEVPDEPRAAYVSWVEFEVPDVSGGGGGSGGNVVRLRRPRGMRTTG